MKGKNMKRHHQRSTPATRQPSHHDRAADSDEPIRIELKCDAPRAEKVYVAGDFNDWRAGELRLWRDKAGPWKIALFLAPGRYEYRFIVDGEWQDDPSSSARVPNEFGSNNSVLEIHAGETERLAAASAAS
jgi:1,4-alpha-glucan branching enzyme